MVPQKKRRVIVMRIINRGRACGKTYMLISAAYVTGTPIIVETIAKKKNIEDMAKDMNVEIEVFTVSEWLMTSKQYRKNEKVLIDEAKQIIDKALSEYLKATVIAVTMTIPMRESINKKGKLNEENNTND